MLWQIFLVIVLGYLVVLRWQKRNFRKIATQLKSELSTYPIIGSAHHFVGGRETRMTMLKNMGREAIKNNGWCPLWLGTAFYGVVADAVEIEYIARNYLEKDDLLKVSQELLGNGSIFAPVPIWRPRRKVLAPTFSQKNLNQFVDVFSKQSAILVEKLEENSGKGSFSMWNDITSYTMDAVCQTTLGINLSAQEKQDHPFPRWLQKFANICAARLVLPWLHNETAFKFFCFWSTYPEFRQCIDGISNFVLEMIKNKRAALEERAKLKNNNIDKMAQEESTTMKPFLELLIEASGGNEGYTDKELQEEAQVILAAGTDTSAVGACFAAVMLSQHPEIQEKVYAELQEIYGDSNRAITAEDIPRLKYLELVIKETLRLYPPVPVTARKILKDGLTPGGIKLIPGMGVVINHWAVMRNPKYWGDDAEVFRPERFIDNPPTHPAAYIPFGYGPRNCVGYKYAMMSMMTVTATLLRKFHILPAESMEVGKPLRVTFEIMMKHVNNFEVKLQLRR